MWIELLLLIHLFFGSGSVTRKVTVFKICVFACTCSMFICRFTCVHILVEAKIQPWLLFLKCHYLAFWHGDSHQPGTSQLSWGALSVRPKKSSVSVFLVLGLQAWTTLPGFMLVRGIKFRSPCYIEHFTNWAISQPQNIEPVQNKWFPNSGQRMLSYNLGSSPYKPCQTFILFWNPVPIFCVVTISNSNNTIHYIEIAFSNIYDANMGVHDYKISDFKDMPWQWQQQLCDLSTPDEQQRQTKETTPLKSSLVDQWVHWDCLLTETCWLFIGMI